MRMVAGYSFEGIGGGDGECFCWFVNRETFIEITANEPEEYDKADLEGQEQKIPLFRVYPNQVLRYAGMENGKRCRFIIEVEPVNKIKE